MSFITVQLSLTYYGLGVTISFCKFLFENATFWNSDFFTSAKKCQRKIDFHRITLAKSSFASAFFFPFLFFDLNTEISVIFGSASLIQYIYVMSSFSYSLFYLFKGVKWSEFYGVTTKHFFQPFLRNSARQGC